MLDKQIFEVVVKSSPLVSIDLIVKNEDKVLLGKRVNNPAKGYFFSVGGRIFKNEKINDAMARIAQAELGVSLQSAPKFIGVFEHFYDDSDFNSVSTHYVNLAYEVLIDEDPILPLEQHNEYQWLTKEELLESKLVHKYVKDYFAN